EDWKGTYDPDTLLVYHFAERGVPPRDATVWANNAQSAAQPVDGSLIGPGARFDGATMLTLPASPSLAWDMGAPFTWSAWVKPGAPQPNVAIFSRRSGLNAFVIGLDNGAPFVEADTPDGIGRSTPGQPLADSWHHLAVTAARTGSQ